MTVLVGCQKPAETVPPAALRNQSAPVAAQVDATEARIAGNWRVVAGVGIPVGSKVSIGQGVMAVNGSALPLAQVGPGQFMAGGTALWVHWLDADARTVAMGDPDGHWYFVMDRTGKPGERMTAAKTILDWYGYDTTRL
ncbi:MAG: lipocalin [Thalassococcus sp.]|uniref:lipocalin n=1 Tax=Thalassococcus sp. TaxID=1928858 RepID=UPI001B15D159|nr:lipocalin [Thalassococcus sp.]MBO6866128.1 lipocalin [Thalassococcus sp.]